MANRKSASKQAPGGASRSPNPQPAKRKQTASTGSAGNTLSKPPTSSNQPSSPKVQTRIAAPKPQKPQVAANHSSNGTRSQATGNKAQSQGTNGLSWIFGGTEPTSGRKVSQDRSTPQAAPAKRAGNGLNNTQKVQGHAPVQKPDVSLNTQAPKQKKSQPPTGGHSPAPNSVLTRGSSRPRADGTDTRSSPPRPGNAQHSLFSGVDRNQPGQKVFEDQSSTRKTHTHIVNAPSPPKNVTPLPAKAPPSISGGSKDTKNRPSDSPNQSISKRHSSTGSPQANTSAKQSPAAAEGLGLSGWLSPWLPSTGQPPVQATKKLMPSSSKGVSIHPPPTHSRITRDSSHKAEGHKNNRDLPKPTVNEGNLGQQINAPSPTKNATPPPAKASPSMSANGTKNRPPDSLNQSGSKRSGSHQSAKQSPAAAESSGSLGWVSSLFPSAGQPLAQATKKPMASPSKGTGTHPPLTPSRITEELSDKGHKNNRDLPKPTMNDGSLGRQINSPSPTKNVTLPPAKASQSISAKGTENRPSDSLNQSGSKRSGSHQVNMSAKQSPAAAESSDPLGWLSSWLPSAGQPPVQATTKQMPSSSQGISTHPPPTHSRITQVEGHKKNHDLPKPTMNDGSLGRQINAPSPPKNVTPPPAKASPSISGGSKGTKNRSADSMNQSGSKRHSSSEFQANMSAKQSPPAAEGLGLSGWLSSWLPSTGRPPVQATKKPMPSPSKGMSTHPPPTHPHTTQESSIKEGHKKNRDLPKPTMNDGFLGRQINAPSPTENVTPPPAKVSPSISGGSKGIKNRSSDSMNQSGSPPAVAERSGLFGWLSSRLPTTRRPLVQATEKPMPIPSKVTTDRTQKSSKHQPVRVSSTVKDTEPTSVPRRIREFQVGLNSSKGLSRAPKTTTTVRKGLLRQRSPTLTWQTSESPKVVSAYSTVTAAPLPSPPKNQLQNKVACKTIAQNPDLFKIVSPIKVEAFKKNLKDHPNQPFVKSVVNGLKNGFWPFADTSNPALPTTYDGSRQRQPIGNKDKARADFVRQQRDEEIELERWSRPFGKKLLPGMHSSPIAAVPKSTPGKYRLIIDQSCGPHALNSTIPKSQVKVKLDNIHDLGATLLAVRKKHPKRKLCLFKSDVKSAYRQLPVHPLWQIKQVVSIDGKRYVDRCNTFGNRAGGWNWNSVASLVNWIGAEKKKIPDLLGYVDDNFGWEFEGNKKYYKPYKKQLPAKQARLLELWDELGIPHDEEKQLSGPSLPILGYEVDANAMTVKVPDEKKAKVTNLLRDYAHEGKSYTLKELQSVAGSTGAALSLYPRLRPGLRGLFDEMAGKEGSSTKLVVTKPVARCLSNLADYLEHAQPIRIQEKKQTTRTIE